MYLLPAAPTLVRFTRIARAGGSRLVLSFVENVAVHELSISRNIVEIASAHADGRDVSRLRLAVGKLSAVMPDALRFCFETARQDTPLHRAQLEIIEIEGLARCAACQQTFVMPITGARCGCGHRQFTLLAGDELKIVEMELDEVSH